MSTSVRKEFRKYPRVDVDWPARFSINDWTEYCGALKNVSGGGMAVASDAAVRVGDRVVLYTDSDRFEGRIARILSGGFAIQFELHKLKRNRLIAKLMWQMNEGALQEADERRSLPRHRTVAGMSTCYLAGGKEILCRVLDMSLISANIEASYQPLIGSKIRVGRAEGTVVRLTPGGFAVIFDRPGDEKRPAPAELEKAIFDNRHPDGPNKLRLVS